MLAKVFAVPCNGFLQLATESKPLAAKVFQEKDRAFVFSVGLNLCGKLDLRVSIPDFTGFPSNWFDRLEEGTLAVPRIQSHRAQRSFQSPRASAKLMYALRWIEASTCSFFNDFRNSKGKLWSFS